MSEAPKIWFSRSRGGKAAFIARILRRARRSGRIVTPIPGGYMITGGAR